METLVFYCYIVILHFHTCYVLKIILKNLCGTPNWHPSDKFLQHNVYVQFDNSLLLIKTPDDRVLLKSEMNLNKKYKTRNKTIRHFLMKKKNETKQRWESESYGCISDRYRSFIFSITPSSRSALSLRSSRKCINLCRLFCIYVYVCVCERMPRVSRNFTNK